MSASRPVPSRPTAPPRAAQPQPARRMFGFWIRQITYVLELESERSCLGRKTLPCYRLAAPSPTTASARHPAVPALRCARRASFRIAPPVGYPGFGLDKFDLYSWACAA